MTWQDVEHAHVFIALGCMLALDGRRGAHFLGRVKIPLICAAAHLITDLRLLVCKRETRFACGKIFTFV
jgi:hypothetical protein